MQFDSENKNSKWYDAIMLEMESMLEYKVFKKWEKAILDKHKKVKNPPKGYQRIKIHLVFAVKFDGRHKARLHCNRDLPLISIFHPKKIKGFLTLIKKSMIAEKN